ncbi:MAG TPA: FHA domain-containing protein [Myxococcota bacterium]|nr:FHA domain-containing protein [Myxococcota bacterium]
MNPMVAKLIVLALLLAGLILVLAAFLRRRQRVLSVSGCQGQPGRYQRQSDVWRLIPTSKNHWTRHEIVLSRGNYRVGRAQGNDIVLDCRFVSREHAVFRVASGWLVLLGSELHSPIFVRCSGASKFRKLGASEEFRFDTGDLLSFNSPDGGMVFQVVPGGREEGRW